MNIKDMKIFVMFDLPTETVDDRRNYSIFRKKLIKLGYIMIQFSVYIKNINVKTKVEREEAKLKEICPNIGNIRMLSITDFQYTNMKIINGQMAINEIVNNEKYHITL